MSSFEPTTRQWVQSLIEPGVLLFWAATSYTRVSLETIFLRGQPLTPILQSKKLRDEAFGRFWISFTSATRDQPYSTALSRTQPTQPQNSTELIPPLLSLASGVVLDIGPGTGTQMPLLRGEGIKAIYGAEPCVGLHGDLRQQAETEGVGDKYRILPCSVSAEELVPELRREGLLGKTSEGRVFDTILCVRVLCSIPQPEKTLKDLYALLKPGGKMLVTEHVVNPWQTAKGSFVARAMQSLYQLLGWSVFLGDCCLTRDTESALRGPAEVDGGWERVELERSFGRSPLAYISGVLVKKGGD